MDARYDVMVVFGTRPEAIKLAPVVRALRRKHRVHVCVTGQHRTMLDQVLRTFQLQPDLDLAVMQPNQDLYHLTANVVRALAPVLSEERPRLVVVQGDTTTTFAAALAAFYAHIPVAHVEAGLRTGDKHRPFPEEVNRRLTSVLADLHFAPTTWAKENLLREGIAPERISVTGNTGIDALLWVAGELQAGRAKPALPNSVAAAIEQYRVLLVTGHRRESFGGGFERICHALRRIVEEEPEVAVVYPVHLNPNVRQPVLRLLGNHPRLLLLEPLEYVTFVALMQRATLILTDSGGIQEEAPSLRKPVLVMRDKTERPEGLQAGAAKLVGTDVDAIVRSVSDLLHDRELYESMTRVENPYGDGRASERIAERIGHFLETGS